MEDKMKCDLIQTYYIEAHSKKELKRRYKHIIDIKVRIESYRDNTSLYEVRFAQPIYTGELDILYGQ